MSVLPGGPGRYRRAARSGHGAPVSGLTATGVPERATAPGSGVTDRAGGPLSWVARFTAATGNQDRRRSRSPVLWRFTHSHA
jgi:hypothetical protein